MTTHPTIGSVAMGDTEAAMVTPEMTKAALAAYRLNALSMIQTRSLDVYETELMHRVITAALSTRPAQEPVAYTTLAELAQVRSGYYGRMQDDANDFGWSVPLYAAPQPVLSQPEVKAETGVRHEWDGIAGKMRYFGSSAPNGWIGDDGEKAGSDDWFSQVVSFLVKNDMLDARDEYHISDVMGALQDNYEPKPALCPLSDIPAQAGEVLGIERPISSPLRRETEETWKQVIDLFRKHGLSEPPVRLRDELVVALEWAWYGQARASLSEGSTDV